MRNTPAAQATTNVTMRPTNADDIIEYLRQNPSFFQENKSIIDEIVPNGSMDFGSNVVSMQGTQLRKLQEQIGSYKRRNQMLIQTSLDNQKSFEDIHTLILNLMRCTTLECIERTVTAHISTMEVDSVKFLTVGTEEGQMTPEQVTDLKGEEYHSIILRTLSEGAEDILHGDKAPHIQSDALLILHSLEEQPLAIIAIGSTDKERFHEGQGTELLQFLSEFIGYRLAEVLAH
ncbi:MAG: DUF484 family protein [Pseudomonadota bacterium]|nr:DUF484 family protein [Pseudomonadota bacterium]